VTVASIKGNDKVTIFLLSDEGARVFREIKELYRSEREKRGKNIMLI